MKNNSLLYFTALILLLLKQHNSTAQLIPPTPGTDIAWSTYTGSSVFGLNTALIDIPDTTADHLNSPMKQLAACAYNRGYGEAIVKDLRSGFQVTITYPVSGFSGYTMANIPDVILGNKAGSSSDFIMAIVFIQTASTPSVEIDYFDIHYITAGTFTVTYNTSSTITPPPGAVFEMTTHIDVVAQSSNLVPYGLPFCDKFFITYDIKGGAFSVYAAYGTLNTHAILAGPVCISTATYPTTDSYQPDVAAIERGPSGSTYPVGLFAFVSQGNDRLYYQEWIDPTGLNIISGYSQLDGTAPTGTFWHPRIDANDDYSTNGGISCQSKVVCEAYQYFTISNLDIGIYSPTGAGTGVSTTSWTNITSLEYPVGSGIYPFPPPTAAPYNHYFPAIAYAPNSSASQYMVSDITTVGSSGDFVLMSPIGAACGAGLAPAPSSALNYFEVSSAYPIAADFGANSVSTACNNVYDTSLLAWSDNGQVFYKRSGYGGTTGYSFKPGINPKPAPVFDDITIFPNPAANVLNIVIPNGNNVEKYCVNNMLGQLVAEGILNANGSIDIGALQNGSYFLTIFSENVPIAKKIFTKK